MENRPSRSLLDQFLPSYDFNEVHRVAVHAPVSRVFTAIKEVELQELPVFRMLFGLRALPNRLRGRSVPYSDLQEPLFRWACRSGFVLLGEVPEQELVFGTIGQPWRLTGGASPATVKGQEFLVFARPEYVTIAANFRLESVARSGSVELSTETRIWGPDPPTRAQFARYWRWVRPGSGLIRREWLRAIKRRAERPAAGGQPNTGMQPDGGSCDHGPPRLMPKRYADQIDLIMNQIIDEDPVVLGAGIGRVLASTAPRADDIQRLRNQLLKRHSDLRLEQIISSEEVVESLFRCSLVHHLQKQYALAIESLPRCINSSHRAVRRVCTKPSAHHHQSIPDDAWAEGWRQLQERPGVNMVVPNHRSPRRADLYVVARNKVVSFEFKYVGAGSLRDAASCAAQIRLHAANHALAFLLLYGAASIDVRDHAVAGVLRDVPGNVRILAVHGPAIAVVTVAA